jgi:hypothetical protein
VNFVVVGPTVARGRVPTTPGEVPRNTSYERTDVPPDDTGGAQVMVMAVALALAASVRGALGTVAGVTGVDVGDADPVPTEFLATTVNV